jgi:hypothetical protein
MSTIRLPQPRAALRAVLAIAAVAIAGAFGTAQTAQAQGLWCAEYAGGRDNATNCGFYTYEQCRATVSGVGGFCRPNPAAVIIVDTPRPVQRGVPADR